MTQTARCASAPRAAPRPVGGAHPRSPPRVHRLGHLPGQPGPHRHQHPPARPASRAPARSGKAARCCRAWPPAGPAAASSRVFYDGQHKATPGYYCHGTGELVEGRGTRHLRVGGEAIDAAVTAAFLAALEPPPRCKPACKPPDQLEARPRRRLAQHRRQVEQARYHAARAERRYRAVDPDNRLVARGLEAEWETALRELADAEAELARREAARPPRSPRSETRRDPGPRRRPQAIWDAPTTTDKDRKQLLRTLLDEVNITLRRDHDRGRADLVLRWKGGAISELTVPIKRQPPRRLRTDEDTIDLIRRLAVHYPDADHRRDPQPAAPPHRPRNVIHRQ